MNPIHIMIIVFATILLYEAVKGIYRQLPIAVEQINLRRKRIALIDTLNNEVHNIRTDIANFNDIYKEYPNIKERLIKVGMLAKNFNRDMDKYHESINKDLKVITDRITKTEGDYKALSEVVANARNRANKAEERTNLIDTTQLIHARSISKLEKPPKSMADTLKYFKNVCKKQNEIARLAYEERMATIEHRQKEYDTSLMTQARMIGDLQKK